VWFGCRTFCEAILHEQRTERNGFRLDISLEESKILPKDNGAESRSTKCPSLRSTTARASR
jgi:hypothetical protein